MVVSLHMQVFENWRRHSVVGLSLDYLVYSLVGFLCYAAYTGALYFSTGVQEAYIQAHHGASSDVQLADVLFAAHAVTMSVFVVYQCTIFERQGQRLSTLCKSVSGLVGFSVLAYLMHMQRTCDVSDCNSWMPLLYFLGGVKILMTVIKYTPQALLNWKRRSTVGWQINNVLLDLCGGMLCLTQIVLDAVSRGELSVITGNPAKLGISSISIAFDFLFIFQHYVLYRSSWQSNAEGQTPVVTNKAVELHE